MGSSGELGSEETENSGPVSANGRVQKHVVVLSKTKLHKIYPISVVFVYLCCPCMWNAASDSLMVPMLIPFPATM